MVVNVKKEGENLLVIPEGRIDAATAGDFSKAIEDNIDGVKNLTFDFEKLEYISSAGLRALLTAQKTMAKVGSMKVIHVADVIMDVFNITGFADILTIE
ncbi:MAG: STAS domain-containing protein [Lachnospiraceae bacterium]|nr:STAS domain-containing protein [Lachnospiraceae bacterium]